MNYFQHFLDQGKVSHWLQYFCRPGIKWERESFQIYGRKVPVPRQLVWFGDKELNYRYTGIDHIGAGWPPEIFELKSMVEERCHSKFNFLLVNRYQNGEDYMGWHRDNEKNAKSKIASLSLGVRRKFCIKLKDSKIDYWLDSGSLLMFDGYLEHRLPKMLGMNELRINLTFRDLII